MLRGLRILRTGNNETSGESGEIKECLVSNHLDRSEYYDVSELSKILRYSRQALTQKLRNGTLPGTRIGRKWLIPKGEIERILPPSKTTGDQEDPAIASRIHWPKLFDTANALMSQLELGAPFAQILGFPWRTYPDYSGRLILEYLGEAEPTVSLEIERDPLFIALKQHLPANPVWVDLETWKSKIKTIVYLLGELYETTRKRSEINDLEWSKDDENYELSPGITEYFAKTAILEAAEKGCGLHQATHEYQQKQLPTHEGYVLEFLRYSSSFVELATVIDEKNIGGLESKHIGLREAMLHAPEIEEICRVYSAVIEVKIALAEKLRRISNMVTLPGICDLYSSD